MDEDALAQQLETLQAEHRRLDEQIAAMMTQETSLNQIELARLKKRKLMLKDQIQLIRNRSVPDIIA